ncbi:hypothetical protein AB833_23610 [Chromatiales bacterium (ex Bugula neritina AB1)]|nr:hypothetical protein AB833_23610 [Chromatiales bacterium (ex Bugula neritina AB1)]
MAVDYPLFRPAGDAALLIEFGATLDLQVNRQVQIFDAWLTRARVEGVVETAPTLRSVLVRFDPLKIDAATLESELGEMLASNLWQRDAVDNKIKRWRLPICYGGETGTDLPEVAQRLGMTVEEAVSRHCAMSQRVLTLGFAPGFMYTGLLQDDWNLPRLDYVKPSVPAGAVSVAVRQTVITSTEIPTGWRTIGCTPFSNFNLAVDPPFLIGPGDELCFFPIDESCFTELADQQHSGEVILQSEQIA